MMLLEKHMQKIALTALLGMAGGMFVGTGHVSAADLVSVDVSQVYICEENEGERDLGNVQILESEGSKGTLAPAGETFEVVLPDGVSFRRGDYLSAGWTTPERKYKNMQLDFSGEQTATVTIFGDTQGIYKDSFNLPLFVEIEDAPEGDLYLKVNGLQSQVPSKDLKFAVISDKGVEVECIQDFSIGAEENGYFILRMTEKVAGSIELDASNIRLKLPEGFSFNTAGKEGGVQGIQLNGVGAFEGKASLNQSNIEENELTFSMKDLSSITRSNDETRGILEITANITSNASVKSGAVKLNVSGNRFIENDSVVVGQIGDFQVYVSVPEKLDVLSGGVGQKIGTIVVTEEVPGSLIAGENIRITFPEEVKLTGPYDVSQVKVSKGQAKVELVSSDENKVTLKLAEITSENETKIEIPFEQVNVEPGFTGDIDVELTGRAGVNGELTLGKAILPVDVSISQVNSVKIGRQNQPLDVIRIRENQGGALKQGEEFTLTFPAGIQLQPGVKVEVVEGNGVIEAAQVLESSNLRRNAVLTFKVKSESSAQRPVTIEIRDINVTVSSLMEYGNIDLKIAGGAVIQSSEDEWIGQDAIWNYHDYPADAYQSQDEFRKYASDHLFPQKNLGRITAAVCENEVSGISVFKVHSVNATIQGEKQVMPVHPYINEKSGRTMLPVRYVAYACGVKPEGVLWDADTQMVSLKAGDKIVELVIGEKTMLVKDGKNQEIVEMDAVPEITDGYTFLPARYVAKAFNYGIGWNAENQTVTINK